MNISGYNSFENSHAEDMLEESSDLASISKAIDLVIEPSENKLKVPTCCRAIAAAEMIAALNGKGAQSLPEEVTMWTEGIPKPTPILIARARQAIDLILSNSELKEVWQENVEDYPKWIDVSNDIKARLS